MLYDDYLRLMGLLTLAADHRKMIEAIERSACAITGQNVADGGHTSDAIWGQDYSARRLLELLDIPVPTPPPTIPRLIGRARELFPEE